MVERVKLTHSNPEMGPETISEISVAVYKERLGADETRRMLEKDGEKLLRSRAEQYDSLTRAYVKVFRKLKLLKE